MNERHRGADGSGFVYFCGVHGSLRLYDNTHPESGADIDSNAICTSGPGRNAGKSLPEHVRNAVLPEAFCSKPLPFLSTVECDI